MEKLTREEFVKQRADNTIEWAERRRDIKLDEIKAGVLQIKDMLLGDMPANSIHQLLASGNYYVVNYLTSILNVQNRISLWIDWKWDHPFFEAFIDKAYLQASYHWAIKVAIRNKIIISEVDDAKGFIDLCLSKGFTHQEIITYCLSNSYDAFKYYDFENRTSGDSAKQISSPFGPYLLGLINNPDFRDDDNEFIYINDLLDAAKGNGVPLLNFILKNKVDFPEDKLQMLFYHTSSHQQKSINQQAIAKVLQEEGGRYEALILELIEKTHFHKSDVFLVYKLLNDALPNKYTQQLLELTKQLIGDEAIDANKTYAKNTSLGVISVLVAEFLHQHNPDACKEILLKFSKEKNNIPINFFNWVDDVYNEESVPYFINGLKQEFTRYQNWTRNQLFELLKKYNLTPYKVDLIDIAINHSNKEGRQLITKLIADKVQPIIPDASKLLLGKTIDLRITGALILSHIKDERVQQLLLDTLDKEKNDDTRDVMLETLAEVKYGKELTLAEVKSMIELADKRRKLKNYKEKWIEESQLPKLYWEEDGSELSQQAVRFIFYRMRRAKGINSELEGKQVFNAIDKERSGPFAKALIKAFIESNANTKFKHFLSIAAFLGNDDVMKDLDSLFKSSIRDKRTKMAEYVIGAIAMIGSDKALRIVEVISRKFANRKRSIAEAALHALKSAAEELNITTDELADRIIPDFGFEGLYKRFDVKGEEYRAFINSDFKINYFNEDGKMRKTVPKDAGPAIKKEFREIEKEVRTIVKSQSGRLEKYMVEGRQWPVEDWRTFFFENPIMFVYAMKLLWIVLDEDEKILDCFYIDEDAGMYNIEDDEIELAAKQKISILHPLFLEEKVRKEWKDKVYEMSMEFIFPILNRPIFKKQVDELEKAYTSKFSEQVVQKGPDFTKSFLEKKGWSKQTGDGGHLEFTKINYKTKTRAYVWIEGIYAWYQQNEGAPPVGAIDFYDLKEKKKKLIKDVNEIFYSEVMADVDGLVKAE